MKINAPAIPDVILLESKVAGDDRGFFFESFNHAKFQAAIDRHAFIQNNHSRSVKNVLRGVHYQILQPQGYLPLVTTILIGWIVISGHFGCVQSGL